MVKGTWPTWGVLTQVLAWELVRWGARITPLNNLFHASWVSSILLTKIKVQGNSSGVCAPSTIKSRAKKSVAFGMIHISCVTLGQSFPKLRWNDWCGSYVVYVVSLQGLLGALLLMWHKMASQVAPLHAACPAQHRCDKSQNPTAWSTYVCPIWQQQHIKAGVMECHLWGGKYYVVLKVFKGLRNGLQYSTVILILRGICLVQGVGVSLWIHCYRLDAHRTETCNLLGLH